MSARSSEPSKSPPFSPPLCFVWLDRGTCSQTLFGRSSGAGAPHFPARAFDAPLLPGQAHTRASTPRDRPRLSKPIVSDFLAPARSPQAHLRPVSWKHVDETQRPSQRPLSSAPYACSISRLRFRRACPPKPNARLRASCGCTKSSIMTEDEGFGSASRASAQRT
jgi:hypothetical protein